MTPWCSATVAAKSDTGRQQTRVTRCVTSIKWARLDSAPFTDRLVRKFRLPVTGWHSEVAARRRC